MTRFLSLGCRRFAVTGSRWSSSRFFCFAFLPQRPKSLVGRCAGKVQAGGQGVDIKPRAAYYDGHFSPGLNFCYGAFGKPLVLCRAQRLIDLHAVEQMVRHPLAFFRRGFCRADIQMPVDLHRVGRNNLAVKRVRQADGKRGFSAGGRTGNDTECFVHLKHPAKKLVDLAARHADDHRPAVRAVQLIEIAHLAQKGADLVL